MDDHLILRHVIGDQSALKQAEDECTGDISTCPGGECLACGERDCPHHEPLHYHHDGCPACYEDEIRELIKHRGR